MLIDLTVNGKRHVLLDVDPQERLVDLLRLRLKLTGAKEGCGEGECGACTVIMDGEAVNSCMVLAYQARNTEILTIEGLAQNGELDTVQQAFVEVGAVQCGYCTPGMVMSAKALLLKNSNPSETEIKEALAGNLCRCTGYVNILKAVRTAADALNGGQVK
ncbi:(2Fe-2S)-binding protein [Sporomusa sp.]|uniref:(2Fe-2S)-binding protein n=1 Tax=Sporomusa sp. TaxID=2078658 RepID=UPI002BFE474B|nr:(2Fe-2S)-binding protein [Sporomusa sp.]HWR45944.1 (2Fe-2S)-binding protein [Sporomusa sp.]